MCFKGFVPLVPKVDIFITFLLLSIVLIWKNFKGILNFSKNRRFGLLKWTVFGIVERYSEFIRNKKRCYRKYKINEGNFFLFAANVIFCYKTEITVNFILIPRK